jgi:hypothetical protein
MSIDRQLSKSEKDTNLVNSFKFPYFTRLERARVMGAF